MRLIAGLAMACLLTSPILAQKPSERGAARLIREIRHEVITLPYYDVFDWVTFQLDGYKVTLNGFVSRPTLKSDIERVVKGIEGVEGVTNKIEVLPLSPNDDRLRVAVYRAVYGHTALQRYGMRAQQPIHIIVKNGNVTLEGVIGTESEKNIAGIQARSVPGVFDVKNNLTVERPAK
jgi:hyperosmotically inducible protein